MEEECEQAWENIIIHLVGGMLNEDLDDLINGVIYSIRDKHHRISLWCKDNNYVGKLKQIGLKLKEVCCFHEKYKFGYQSHMKALKHDLDNEAFLTI